MQDGNVHLAPRVTGNWLGIDPVFDPKTHRITIDASPTVDFRKALEDVGVEVLGKKTDGGAIIGLVTDIQTYRTDGSITTGGDLIIEGTKIRIAPLDDAATGIFFTDAVGTDTPLDHPLTENNPRKIICHVPASLADGEYMLKIVTRFAGSTTLLKHARTITYEFPLKTGV